MCGKADAGFQQNSHTVIWKSYGYNKGDSNYCFVYILPEKK